MTFANFNKNGFIVQKFKTEVLNLPSHSDSSTPDNSSNVVLYFKTGKTLSSIRKIDINRIANEHFVLLIRKTSKTLKTVNKGRLMLVMSNTTEIYLEP